MVVGREGMGVNTNGEHAAESCSGVTAERLACGGGCARLHMRYS